MIGCFSKLQMEEKNICDLFLDNYDRLRNYSLKICKREELAEDITQEVFLSVYTKYSKDDVKIINKMGFLFQAVRFRTYTELKNNHKHVALDDYEFVTDPLRNDFLMEDFILKTLDNIPPQRKKVFQLRRMKHMKVKEIAEIMHIKPKTVENHITIVMKSLRATLNTAS